MLFNGTAAILIDVAGVALAAAGLRRTICQTSKLPATTATSAIMTRSLRPTLFVIDTSAGTSSLRLIPSGVSPNACAHSTSKRLWRPTHLLLDQIQQISIPRMSANGIEIGIVLHPSLRFMVGLRKKAL